MNIESDEVFISSGVVNNISTGAPIALRIKNKDWIKKGLSTTLVGSSM